MVKDHPSYPRGTSLSYHIPDGNKCKSELVVLGGGRWEKLVVLYFTLRSVTSSSD